MAAALSLLAGCGIGFGAGEQDGRADLAITRDYGLEVMLDESVGPLSESSTAMRLLDQSADIETSYGGGFVDSIKMSNISRKDMSGSILSTGSRPNVVPQSSSSSPVTGCGGITATGPTRWT